MTLVICPGVHEPELTDSFLWALGGAANYEQHLIFPAHVYPAFSSLHILQFLQQWLHTHRNQHQCTANALTFLSFSAGVVGAMGAAWAWQQWGGTVRAVIALDGWGVPLVGRFPIHRISHDQFTHWSSALLGGSQDSFYADPPVAHLDLWRSPQLAMGWWMQSTNQGEEVRSPTTAAAFLKVLLDRYETA
ncbi:MAG: hypothetical protein F6K19_27575 [Cyanothece sp. SIO1E1]|nr:hypothetical protein [Cyanothece sp. SIO1E1]